MSRRVITISSDNLLVIPELQRVTAAGTTYVNDATVEVTLLDVDGAEIAGQVWPLSCTYVAGTNGVYSATVQDTIDVEDGQEGTLVVSIDDVTGDLQKELQLDVTFAIDTEEESFWCDRDDVENVFGRANVAQWADLENDQDADDIAARVAWGLREATEEAKSRLAGSVVDLDFDVVPRPLRRNTAILAGVMLYESRGVKDATDEEGRHRLKYHLDRSNAWFAGVKAGTIRIGLAQRATVPAIVDPDEDDDDDDDPFV